MVLLVCFDLPREDEVARKQATAFRKRLINLGFHMKQYSLYERSVRRTETRIKLIEMIKENVPDSGEITIYELPDVVHENQITVLGHQVVQKSSRQPKMRVF